jgi:diacylglycerol O-acyltransferase / wax synthase
MQRLTGQDAAFLYNETPDQHMHTLKIAVLDPRSIPGGYSFELVKHNLAARLHLLPSFRRRLVPVPLQIHHPVWIEDPGFDLDHHIHRAALPAPGGREELDELISDVAGTPLDRSRPLWELWVVEGLEDGAVGFVTKIHHCAADGVMAAALLSDTLSLDPDASMPAPPATPWAPEPVPSRARLVRDAVVDLMRALAGTPALVWRTVRSALRVRRAKRSTAVATPGPFSGPRVSFNRSLTPSRHFVSASLPRVGVDEVRSVFGVSVNDVVLALSTRALRAYLDEHDELPDKPLVASIPVSTRTPGAPLRANSVSNLFTTLPVHLEDPVAQVRAVHEVTRSAKHLFDQHGFDMLAGWSELTPARPYSALIRLYGRRGLAERHRPPVNLVVSSVPGPRHPLYIAGARLTAIYSMGPILEGIGLNITVWSYLQALNFGMVATREHAPDLGRMRGHLRDALDDLREAAAIGDHHRRAH